MKVTLWGTRGSLASCGPETVRYGGNTACVELSAEDGSRLILDAGTGLRRLGAALADAPARIDILLSHLHLDHLQGLGFFAPLYDRRREVHIWGPPSRAADLRTRLGRYLSPPLFPVRLRDLGPHVVLHDAPAEPRRIGPFVVKSALVIHPGSTVGYRIGDGARSLAYLPDHEPALGARHFPGPARWTSGAALAAGVDLLIHDAQYTDDEYPSRVGWGHSRAVDALAFARLTAVDRLVTFHHDPAHDDARLDALHAELEAASTIRIERGQEGRSLAV